MLIVVRLLNISAQKQSNLHCHHLSFRAALFTHWICSSQICGSGVVSPHYIDLQCLGTNHYLTLLPILQEKVGPISVVSWFLFAVNKNTRVFPMTQTATMIISCLSPQGACHPHKNSNYTVTIVVSGLLCLLTGFIVLTFCGSQGVVSRH